MDIDPKTANVALVTGANKGLGFVLVKLFAQQNPKWLVYLGARDEAKGSAAIEKLRKDHNLTNVRWAKLDLDSLETIQKLAETLAREHPQGLKLLINNAGIMPKVREPNQSTFKFDVKAVSNTLQTNLHGTFAVCQYIIPLMVDNGCVINISSRLARSFYHKLTPSKQERFSEASTPNHLVELAEEFLSKIKVDQDLCQADWLRVNPSKALHLNFCIGDLIPLGLTHAALAKLTQILQKLNPRLAVNAVCPGSIKTDMNSNGVYSPEHGADSVLYLVSCVTEKPWDSQVQHIKGCFVAERKVYEDWRQVPSDISEDND